MRGDSEKDSNLDVASRLMSDDMKNEGWMVIELRKLEDREAEYETRHLCLYSRCSQRLQQRGSSGQRPNASQWPRSVH